MLRSSAACSETDPVSDLCGTTGTGSSGTAAQAVPEDKAIQIIAVSTELRVCSFISIA